MASSRAKLAAAIAAGVAALIVLVTATAITYSAVVLPGCDSCHMVGEFAAQTKQSAHTSIECASCHVGSRATSRLDYGVHVVTRTTVNAVTPGQKPPNTGRTEVANSVCLECHTAVTESVVAGNGLRMLHEKCAVGSQCTDCHSMTAHGTAVPWPRTYSMDKCLHCHGQNDTLVQCDKCHEDLSLIHI